MAEEELGNALSMEVGGGAGSKMVGDGVGGLKLIGDGQGALWRCEEGVGEVNRRMAGCGAGISWWRREWHGGGIYAAQFKMERRERNGAAAVLKRGEERLRACFECSAELAIGWLKRR